ncbi:hypothetical protein RRG08_036579 [Elysia crispata]|uniref:Uncharacterized protein n=1 Tax=Elysia crispata TaxID=231223 RepID=A0AAE0ZQT1_9GAST|nr:hypothetical protein RRG08_036579 [Elysia crispata]
MKKKEKSESGRRAGNGEVTAARARSLRSKSQGMAGTTQNYSVTEEKGSGGDRMRRGPRISQEKKKRKPCQTHSCILANKHSIKYELENPGLICIKGLVSNHRSHRLILFEMFSVRRDKANGELVCFHCSTGLQDCRTYTAAALACSIHTQNVSPQDLGTSSWYKESWKIAKIDGQVCMVKTGSVLQLLITRSSSIKKYHIIVACGLLKYRDSNSMLGEKNTAVLETGNNQQKSSVVSMSENTVTAHHCGWALTRDVLCGFFNYALVTDLWLSVESRIVCP